MGPVGPYVDPMNLAMSAELHKQVIVTTHGIYCHDWLSKPSKFAPLLLLIFRVRKCRDASDIVLFRYSFVLE